MGVTSKKFVENEVLWKRKKTYMDYKFLIEISIFLFHFWSPHMRVAHTIDIQKVKVDFTLDNPHCCHTKGEDYNTFSADLSKAFVKFNMHLWWKPLVLMGLKVSAENHTAKIMTNDVWADEQDTPRFPPSSSLLHNINSQSNKMRRNKMFNDQEGRNRNMITSE